MNKKSQIEVIIQLSKTKDTDLIEVYKRIGDKAFKEIAKICLLSLIEPTFYDEKKIKSCLCETNPHKAQNESVKVRLTFYEEWKKEGVLQIKKELRENITLSSLTKTLIRQRIASELIPICFKKRKNIILLDKEFIPILKSAKINLVQKVVTTTAAPTKEILPAIAKTVEINEENEQIKADLPFEESPAVKAEIKDESVPQEVEELPIEETPILSSFESTGEDEEEDEYDACLDAMISMSMM